MAGLAVPSEPPMGKEVGGKDGTGRRGWVWQREGCDGGMRMYREKN